MFLNFLSQIKITSTWLWFALAIFLVSCTRNLDSEKIENVIKNGFSEQTGITVNFVTCPENIEMKENSVFECEIQTDKGKLITAEVTQSDDRGNINWNASKELISTAAIEQEIQMGIRARLESEVTVNCGSDRFKIISPGQNFNCNTTDNNGNSNLVKVSVNDDRGNITWETLQTSILNTNEVAATIKNGFEQRTSIAANFVICPQNTPMNANHFFECEINTKHGNVVAAVTQTDDRGNIDWKVNNGLISIEAIEKQIQVNLQEQLNVSLTVNCGSERFKIAFPGDTFNCEVRDRSRSRRTVRVSVENKRGNVVWNLL